MTVRQLIPQGLSEMAPGPELAMLLAGIDMSALTGADAVEVLRARHRQLSHDQARLLAAIVEVGLCDPSAEAEKVARLADSPLYAADEIRAALSWTRRAADREHYFAETLVQRMPAVFAALDTGRIDRAKAWIFTDFCAELTAEHTEVVCQRLLPHAGRLTTGELAARIKKIAITAACDPSTAGPTARVGVQLPSRTCHGCRVHHQRTTWWQATSPHRNGAARTCGRNGRSKSPQSTGITGSRPAPGSQGQLKFQRASLPPFRPLPPPCCRPCLAERGTRTRSASDHRVRLPPMVTFS